MTTEPNLAFRSPAGRWVVAATVLGSGMAAIDATVVGIALPTIGREFHAPLSALQWVVTGYAMTLAAFLLLGGSLGDHYGRRRIFSIGVVWFAVASVACALAPGTAVLVVMRILQGVGAALLTPGAWPSSRRRSAPTTAAGPSGPGPASAAWPPPSGRSSAGT